MSTSAMPGNTWQRLIKAKRQSALYRITLMIRGKKVVKEYTRQSDFNRWMETFKAQMAVQKDNAIESIKDEIVYR